MSRNIDKLILRYRSLIRRARLDEQLDIELAFHLEQQIEENVAAGMSPREAELAARRAMGGLAQIKEQCRDARRVAWITDLLSDVRFGMRVFARTPGLAATIIVTLAIGIGANTAVFSVTDALLLRRLPLPEPERLIQILQPDGPGLEQYGERFSLDDYRNMRDAASPLADLAAETGTLPASAVAGGSEETVRRNRVSGNYFGTLGISCAAGRAIVPQDMTQDGAAIISFGFWQRRFNLDPKVLGRRIRVGEQALTIVGITRHGFSGLEAETPTDIWTPIARTARHNPAVRVIARLRGGATDAQVMAALQPLFHNHMLEMIGHAPPGTPRLLIDRLKLLMLKSVPANRGFSSLRGEYRQPLGIVSAMVALVLLIASLNIAGLLMARATERKREIAVRVSLGADQFRVLRQLFAESILLCVLATPLGVAVGQWTGPLLVTMLAPAESPVHLALALDGRLISFAVLLCAGVTFICGASPAWRASNMDIHTVLKGGVSVGAATRVRTGKIIVASQVALSVVLLISSILFVRTLHYLSTCDTGFERGNGILATIHFRGADRGEPLHQLWEDLLHRVSSIPGVECAGLSSGSVFHGASGTGAIRLPGIPAGQKDLNGCLFFRASTNFLRASGTPLVEGRDFGPADFGPAANPVAIVSETFARVFFGRSNPIGKKFSNFEDVPPRWVTVIGVAKDTRYETLRSAAPPIAYLPYSWPHPAPVMSIVVRSRTGTQSVEHAIQATVSSTSSYFSISEITTQQRLIDRSLVRERLLASIGSVFAMLALMIAAIGLYGLISYTAAQRTQEIGIRMAIGAAPGDVVRTMIGESLITIMAGASAGLVLSAAAARWISSLLFGVRAQDPATVFAAMLVLGAVAIASVWLPARRAARIDPMTSLRCQ